MKGIGPIFRDLRRRGVLQTTAVYIVAAWVILQVAGTLLPGAGIPDSAIRFVFIGVLLGFPLVMVFGWMYDITGKGILRTRSPGQAVQGSLPLRRFDYVLLSGLSLLTVTLVIGVSAKVINEAGPLDFIADYPPVAENSIAVLPFVNLSGDPDDDYFGDGLAEELLNELANLSSLQVAARTSSFFFKGKNEPIPSIGRQLGVKSVLEGSVRKSGDRIRVTAQLINAASGYHIWSENFDRKSGDIFAIQEEIARAISSSLEVKVLSKESVQLASVPTENFDAYDYYLLGQHHRERRNPESLEKSIELFKQALDLDDRFALAYTALALSHLYQAYHSDLSPEQVKELTDPLIEKSLELDPSLAKTHGTRASVRLLLNDFSGADAGFRKAIELQPSYSGAWGNLGFSLVRQSRLEEAAAAYAKSEELDPLNANQKYNSGALMMLTGRYEEGVEALSTVIRLAPERVRTESALVHWSIVYGRYDEAARWIKRLLEREPDSSRAAASLAKIYGYVGMWDEAWDAISRAHEISPDDVNYIFSSANLYLLTGNYADFTAFVSQEYEKIDKLAPTRHSPTNRERYFWHGMAALLEGRYIQAIDDLTEAAGGETGIANSVYDNIRELKYLALAYQKQGRNDDADALLNQSLGLAKRALEQGWATPTIYYRTAQVYALLGDSDEAIALLRQAVDKGWREVGVLEADPRWGPLQDDVRFQSIVTAVNNELQLLREQIPSLLDGTDQKDTR